ncbi:hypothetical protein [Streptomyces capoamus]|nr:hypothetical protein [Streptomyces capoamus]
MTDLLATCKKIAEHHAPEGTWVPSTSDLLGRFGESMQVMADISEQVNRTRRGMHRIANRARERLYHCDNRRSSHQ